MVFNYGFCQQQNWQLQKKGFAGHFDDHGDAGVQCGVHLPMEHISGLTSRSHWMPPSGDCLRHIVSEAAMVDKFVVKHKTLTKTSFS
jgi:hypothetical protein